MPDPKRAARIYLPTTTVELLESGKNCWMLGMQTEPSERFPVPFEPAVPRCKTCNRYSPPHHETSRYGWCRMSQKEEKAVPPDGSGFCHEHTEAKGR